MISGQSHASVLCPLASAKSIAWCIHVVDDDDHQIGADGDDHQEEISSADWF